ncbi:MAG: hypothetical protein RLY57_75 [Candidatus Parcubacteria bacterium]|jgi:leucyl-tRNA synthetase
MKKNTSYDHIAIEKKWQKEWSKKKTYKTLDPKKAGKKPKYYVLDMFPYPSGEGLHVGHPKGYIATDVVSRMKRMQGHNVLHPMGFDAFGLPAEQYAIKMKTNPAVAVGKNVARYKKQLEILGLDYDWSREVNTTDPKYYKWTQWIFLKLLERGLAYESYEPINWCPTCKTGLANEDLEDGKCERCGTPVEKKPMRQWVLKITEYADRMLEDLDATDYVMPKLIDKVNPHQKGAPIVKRQVAHAIVFDPQHKKYLIIRNKKFNWDTVVIGGIEGNESPVETAQREVREETGYVDIEFKRILGGQTEAQYYTKHKGENRIAYATAVYFELKSDKRVSIAEGEDGQNEILWIDEKDFVPGKMVNSELEIWLERIKDPAKGWGTPLLNWPQSIKEAQRNWIGRSEGMLFTSPVKDSDIKIKTFSAHFEAFKADTFVVIAPDHPLLKELIKGAKNENEIIQFAEQLIAERSASGYEYREPKGIFTGKYTIDPVGNGELPIWIANYALADYGTGIVKCSAHDERDFAFAKKYQIPLKVVLLPEDKELAEKVKKLEVCYVDMKNGILHEPKEFHGKKAHSVRSEIISYLIDNNLAEKKTTYRLKDWVFSRQRYWGEPIPVYHTPDGRVVPVPEKELPVVLPMVKSYEPTGTGESPLAAIEKWVNVPMKVNGKKEIWKRETNTMPQWAGSSWYYLRYMDPKNTKKLVDPKIEQYWNQTDLYVGGAEHATRHLIYARFWHKFLYDLGVVSTKEPFMKLQSVGLIMAEDGRKMSKRWGNVVNPDDIIATYGADTMRVYEMFMGPFNQAIAWNTQSMVGSRRFIERIWNLQNKVQSTAEAKKHSVVLPEDAETLLHQTIKKVTEDIESMGFNTAISAMMILLNRIEKEEKISREVFAILIQLLAPFAPHVTEELWKASGNKGSIHLAPWPTFDTKKLQSETVTISIQVNGKIRGSITCNRTDSKEAILQAAKGEANVSKWIEGKHITKEIYVPGKLVSIVVD